MSVDNLVEYTPAFKKGEGVIWDGTPVLIKKVNGDGTYVLSNGSKDIAEDELSQAEIFSKKDLVRIIGEKGIFKVLNLKKGQYRLENIFDKTDKRTVEIDEVDKAEPEYAVGELVQLSDWATPKEIVKVNSKKFTYKLKGDKIWYREIDLQYADKPDTQDEDTDEEDE